MASSEYQFWLPLLAFLLRAHSDLYTFTLSFLSPGLFLEDQVTSDESIVWARHLFWTCRFGPGCLLFPARSWDRVTRLYLELNLGFGVMRRLCVLHPAPQLSIANMHPSPCVRRSPVGWPLRDSNRALSEGPYPPTRESCSTPSGWCF